MKMIRTKTELIDYLDGIGYEKTDYRIAVEALIFTPEGEVILEERGPGCRDEVGKLEGVGGRFDHESDLHEALQEEIRSELGADFGGLAVKIERLLEVRQVAFEEAVGPRGAKRKELKDWVVVSYLCRITAGEPVVGEPHKIKELHKLTLDEVYAKEEADLSKSVVMGRETYRTRYGNRPFYEMSENE